jgi:D-alanine-D-alanine ligase
MDKVATKQAALMLRVATPPMFILNPLDSKAPFGYPVVVKPVHEGSTVGLHVVMDQAGWERAIATIRAEAAKGVVRGYLVEPKVGGASWARELTVGVLDGSALPIVEIKPKGGLYDYDAKYVSNETKYVVDPELPAGVGDAMKRDAVNLCRALQCRHIARVDFMLGSDARAWMLEVNTTPGMTDHSLVPKAALKLGMTMPALCRRLVELALRDGAAKSPAA